MALAVAIPLIVMIERTNQESQHRANQNAALIKRLDHVVAENATLIKRLDRVVAEQSRARVRNRERFAASDRAICIRVEAIKSQIRQSVKFNEAATRRTLRQLGINPDSARGQDLIERSRASSAATARKFKAVKCADLPSAKATEPQPKKTG